MIGNASSQVDKLLHKTELLHSMFSSVTLTIRVQSAKLLMEVRGLFDVFDERTLLFETMREGTTVTRISFKL